ncbi:MAG: ABC transporter ATP-binding protein [Muribaculaceae bacterium]|nr:ABC transporter ATP-binding protein [Muribaculaceae bacterium]
MKELVKAIELSTGYGEGKKQRIVGENLNAALLAGELTALIGPNGVGKSTLMRTLSGFQAPCGGKIEIMGRDISDLKRSELAKMVSVVLTEKPSLDNMKVEELVELGRSPYTGFFGRAGIEDKEMVESAIEQVGIESLRDRYVSSLSDGERQKVMIAKALAQSTPVIFLDEPSAFLDWPSKAELFRLLRRLAQTENKAILLSTHDLEIAFRLSDRFWIMDREKQLTVSKEPPYYIIGEGGEERE